MIRATVTLSSQSFGYFFRPSDLESGRYLLEDDDTVPVDEFGDQLDVLCS